MACKHKFYDYLNCDNLDFQPRILIIGTFNPEWSENNYSNWFYGRTNNNYFWEVLPRIFKEESLKHIGKELEWKKFCIRNLIALTDLISSINDADKNTPNHLEVISKFKDNELVKTFNEFKMTDVVAILEKHSTIKNVYFTRKKGVNLFDNEMFKIQDYCLKKQITFSYLLTPSKNAKFQMRGYEPKNPNLERSLSNFIYEKWLENWRE